MLLPALRGCLLVALFSATAAFASDVTIVRVFTGWRDAASFKRISEYFSGKENPGGQVILRTHPGTRDGYYFLVRLAQAAPAGRAVQFRVSVIRPATDQVHVFNFPARAEPGPTVFNLGLTGTDWPNPEASPVAWKLDVLTEDGATLLASEQSYLWAKPAGK